MHDIQKLNRELERRIGWYLAGWVCSVSKLGRDGEHSLASYSHAHKSHIPSLNDLSRTQVKFERSSSVVRTVKFRSVFKLPFVVDDEYVSAFRHHFALPN